MASVPIIRLTKDEIETFKAKRNAPPKAEIDETISELKKWLEQQPHLPKIDEDMLRKFLFGCKYKVDDVKLRLNNYYTARGKHAIIYGERDPLSPALQSIFDMIKFAIMPQITKQGYRISCSVLSHDDPENYEPAQLIKYSEIVYDLLLRDEEEICTPGVVVVICGANSTAKHAMKWDLSLIRTSQDILLKTRPESIKGFHLIDMPSYIKPLFTIMSTLLSTKLRKRISYNSPEVLFKQVPKDMLPDEFGGTAGPLTKYSDMWIDHMKNNRDWLLNEGSLKADMTCIPKNNEEAVFTDTFRKLEFD